MPSITLPPQLEARLGALPNGPQAHIGRVRTIARELATAHGVDAHLAELTAAAHDVARHLPPGTLLEEAERLGLAVHPVEHVAPVLLHGPVGAAWLAGDGTVTDLGVLEGVHWHTTAHPDLAPVGKVVFLADKLDLHKAKVYPFQAAVQEAAFKDLGEGILAFLDGALRQHLERGQLIHPTSTDTRNALLMASGC